MRLHRFSPHLAAAVLFATSMLAVSGGAEAGNPFMDQVEAARTRQETDLATKWDCLHKSPFAHTISAAPFKYVGEHVCLQGYVGALYDEHEFAYYDAWPIGSPYDDQDPVIVLGDAKNLSAGQYVEVYGTIVQAAQRKVSGGTKLFGIVKPVIVDTDLSGMGQRLVHKTSTKSPESQ